MAKQDTTEQAWNPNPTGKGGFGDHPENRNPGGWNKNESYQYWLNFFKRLTVEEFEAYPKQNPAMTMAARGAYERIKRSVTDMENFREVANRTEGMPKQKIENEIEITTALVRFIDQPSKELESGE